MVKKYKKRKASRHIPISVKFIKEVLEPGEKLVSSRKLHWIYLMGGVNWLLFFLIVGIGSNYLVAKYIGTGATFYLTQFGYIRFSDSFSVFMYLCIFAGLFIFISDYIRYKTTVAILTNKRLIYKVGWIRVKIDETDLSDIRGIHVDQGWLGYLLNYGRVCMDCRFIEDVHLPHIRNPYSFVKMMHKMRSEAIEEENTVHIINEAGVATPSKLSVYSNAKENLE